MTTSHSLILWRLWPTMSIRGMMIAVALASVLAAVTVPLVKSRYERIRTPASQRIFRPIIRYHTGQIESNYQNRLSMNMMLRIQIQFCLSEIDNVIKDSTRVLSDREFPFRGIQTRWILVAKDLHHAIRQLHIVRDTMRELAITDQSLEYQKRLLRYYDRLYYERRTKLPPLPASLEAERLKLQAAVRIFAKDPELLLEPEPPIHLDPNAARRKTPQKPVK